MRPVIYVTRQFHDAYLADWPEERWWVRSILTPPRFREESWVIWQHDNRGRVQGVDGPVDLNVMRGPDNGLAGITLPVTDR